jgi:hypothetical protein
MVKASIKIRKRPLQNDQKLLLKNNEKLSTSGKVISLYPDHLS